MRRIMVGVVICVALVLAVPIYFKWGWSRMDEACGFGPSAVGRRHFDAEFGDAESGSVSYSWHWSEGFTCTYSNGKTRSSFWF